MAVDQRFVDALEIACQYALEGDWDITTLTHRDVTIGVNPEGEIEVLLDYPNRALYTGLYKHCQRLHKKPGRVHRATPDVGKWEITFRPDPRLKVL